MGVFWDREELLWTAPGRQINQWSSVWETNQGRLLYETETPGLWEHASHPIQFLLLVVEFFVRLPGRALQHCTLHTAASVFFWWAQVELTWKTRFFAPSVWNSKNIPCLSTNGGESGKQETCGHYLPSRRKSWEIQWRGYGMTMMRIRPPPERNTTCECLLSTPQSCRTSQ